MQYLNNQNCEYSIIQTKLPQILTHWSLSSLVTPAVLISSYYLFSFYLSGYCLMCWLVFHYLSRSDFFLISSIFHFCPSLLPIQKSSIYQHSIIDRVRSRPPISRVLRLSWLLSFHAFLSMHHSSLPLLFVPSILLILFHPRLLIHSSIG